MDSRGVLVTVRGSGALSEMASKSQQLFGIARVEHVDGVGLCGRAEGADGQFAIQQWLDLF